MNYKKSENIEDFALCYGEQYENKNIPFSLMVKEYDDEIEMDCLILYSMKNIDYGPEFSIPYLERKYYENPENFTLSSINLELKREGSANPILRDNKMRYVSSEEYMEPFEREMFRLLKKAYQITIADGDLDLLKPGEIGVDRNNKVYLYLGKFKNCVVEVSDIDYDTRGRETMPIPMRRIEDNRMGDITDSMTVEERRIYNGRIRNEIQDKPIRKTLIKNFRKNTNVYIEINNELIGGSVYDFTQNISNISPEELEKMIVSIQPSHQRLRFVHKYNGKLEYLTPSDANPITEISFYIPGISYNKNHEVLTHELFGDNLSYNKGFVNDGTQWRSGRFLVRTTMFRKVKLKLGEPK